MTIQDGAAREFAYRLFDCGLEQHSDRRTPVFVAGRYLDTTGVAGRNPDVFWPLGVQESPGNGRSVHVSPKNRAGARNAPCKQRA